MNLTVAVLLPYAYDTVPGQRFRWEQWEPYLERLDIKLRRVHYLTPALATEFASERVSGKLIMSLAARYAHWLSEVLSAVRGSDVVVVARNAALAGPPIVEWLTSTFSGPLVFDFDDAIHLAPESGDTWLRRTMRCDWRVAFIARHAALVGAGNETLEAYARRFTSRTAVWPTTIDTNIYVPQKKSQGLDTVTVGWTGSKSTGRYLKDILFQLGRLQKDCPFHLLVMGADLDLSAYNINGRCVSWSSAREVETISEMDIGLMPLDDTPWSRGKCALKALQYEALGIPAVVSDVGANRRAVLHGETGFLVGHDNDWATPLTRLIEDERLRSAMGKAARQHVENHFSANVVAAKVASDLRSLVVSLPDGDRVRH